jgi:hypothetical protein
MNNTLKIATLAALAFLGYKMLQPSIAAAASATPAPRPPTPGNPIGTGNPITTGAVNAGASAVGGLISTVGSELTGWLNDAFSNTDATNSTSGTSADATTYDTALLAQNANDSTLSDAID